MFSVPRQHCFTLTSLRTRPTSLLSPRAVFYASPSFVRSLRPPRCCVLRCRAFRTTSRFESWLPFPPFDHFGCPFPCPIISPARRTLPRGRLSPAPSDILTPFTYKNDRDELHAGNYCVCTMFHCFGLFSWPCVHDCSGPAGFHHHSHALTIPPASALNSEDLVSFAW